MATLTFCNFQPYIYTTRERGGGEGGEVTNMRKGQLRPCNYRNGKMPYDYRIGYVPNTGLLRDFVRGGFMNDWNQACLGLELKLPFINWRELRILW